MKRFLVLISVALVLLFLSACPTRAAEITIDWRQKLDSNMVNDLHFMPDDNYFIVGSGFDVQVRSCEDGNMVKGYPFGAWRIEFTPDSNRIVTILPINGYKTLQLRNVNDMSLINEYVIPEDEEGYGVSFLEMVVDPVRPYIYTIMQRGKYINGQLVVYRKIQIYDRETLQPKGELTSEEDKDLYWQNLAVSKDGKYLAAMNYGISKLVVWSLDTRQKVIDKFISDQNTDKFSEPAHIKFSELNTDKIYFTGVFYKENNVGNFGGLCIFSISENKIVDSTFALPPNRYGSNPEICFFENETKVIGSSDITLKVLDIIGKRIELEKNILGNNLIAGGNLNYHIGYKYFIGGGGNSIDRFRFQSNTSVSGDSPNEVIYPNPTTGIVNIPVNCNNSSRYEIYNTSGRLLNSTEITGVTNNLLKIDFSRYSNGVYSVKLYCGKTVSQYQIIKEG